MEFVLLIDNFQSNSDKLSKYTENLSHLWFEVILVVETKRIAERDNTLCGMIIWEV
jgi:hypothetical protein